MSICDNAEGFNGEMGTGNHLSVEYSLTEMGQEFRVVLDAVEKWGLDYIKLLEM